MSPPQAQLLQEPKKSVAHACAFLPGWGYAHVRSDFQRRFTLRALSPGSLTEAPVAATPSSQQSESITARSIWD